MGRHYFTAKQLKGEITRGEFELNQLETKIVSADIIRENLKVFKDVFDQLTQAEKYGLMHLLVKKVVYFENTKEAKADKTEGKIKMDLWELPPIDPSNLNSANSFAESSTLASPAGFEPALPP